MTGRAHSPVAWIALTSALAVSGPAEAQSVELLVGSWALDRTASSCPRACPRSETRVYEAEDDGMVYAQQRRVYEGGELERVSYRARHDGSEYPYRISGLRDPSTISFTRVNSRQSYWQYSLNGRLASSGTNTISEDGQTLVSVTRGRWTLVFRRQ